MKSLIKTYKEYSQVHKEFDIKKLKSIYIEKDLKETENKDTLIKKWKQWRRIWMESYGITAEKFPQIIFSSKKNGKEYNCLHANKEIIEDAWDTLSKYGKSSDAIMIYFMFIYELCSEDIRFLKFEEQSSKHKSL